MIDGVTSKPFSAVTLEPPHYKKSHNNKIIAASRKTYARLKTDVEHALLFKSSITNPAKNDPPYGQRLF
jgi:hypothetical protein